MSIVLERHRKLSADTSFGEVYSKIQRLAQWHCSSQDDVDDVTQEAALRICMKGGLTDSTIQKRSPWMNVIVHNAAVDLYRRLARENRFMNRSFDLSTGRSQSGCDEQAREIAAPDNIADRVEQKLLQQRVGYALNELKVEHRQALLMVAEGFSYQHVASQQQIPVGTARSRIFYARQRIQELIVE